MRDILKFLLDKKRNGVILSVTHKSGEMVEWSKAPHWKCGDGQLSEGSNPSLSAIFFALIQGKKYEA